MISLICLLIHKPFYDSALFTCLQKHQILMRMLRSGFGTSFISGIKYQRPQHILSTLYNFRLASSKTGKIYLHTDVRMIIFRKSDLDTAADHESGMGFELRLDLNKIKNKLFSFFSGLSLVVQKIQNFHHGNKGSNPPFDIIHWLL